MRPRRSACDENDTRRQLATRSSHAGRARTGDWNRRRGLHRPRLPLGRLRRRRLSRGRSRIAVDREGSGSGRGGGVPERLPILEEMLDDPAIEVVDIAVPPSEQPGMIDRVLAHPRRVRGHPGAEAAGDVVRRGPGWSTHARGPACCSRSTRTCGMITRCGPSRRCSTRATGRAGAGDDRDAGDPALDALGPGRAIAFDVHHEHPPPRHVPLLAGRSGAGAGEHATRPADRVFRTPTGSICTCSSTQGGAGPAGWDDVWAGPAREGAGPEHRGRWRFEGTEGLALRRRSAGPAGRRGSPARSIIRRSATTATGIGRAGRKPGSPTRSPARWAACSTPSRRAEPDISGRDNLKTIALCEAVLPRGASIASCSRMNSPDRRP